MASLVGANTVKDASRLDSTVSKLACNDSQLDFVNSFMGNLCCRTVERSWKSVVRPILEIMIGIKPKPILKQLSYSFLVF